MPILMKKTMQVIKLKEKINYKGNFYHYLKRFGYIENDTYIGSLMFSFKATLLWLYSLIPMLIYNKINKIKKNK